MNESTLGDGYYCSSCKSWVPIGYYHSCPPLNYQFVASTQDNGEQERLDKIIELLNEIVSLLRRHA
jgi:hypothetical protein